MSPSPQGVVQGVYVSPDSFFEEKSFDLRGWKTEDVYKNDVEFLIKNLKINIPTNQKLFKIPSQDDL